MMELQQIGDVASDFRISARKGRVWGVQGLGFRASLGLRIKARIPKSQRREAEKAKHRKQGTSFNPKCSPHWLNPKICNTGPRMGLHAASLGTDDAERHGEALIKRFCGSPLGLGYGL